MTETKRARPWHDTTPLKGFEPSWAGQFDTFDDWVNHATRALTGVTGSVGEDLEPVCIDAKGRRCHVGRDFMRARDEGAFPIRYFWEFEEACNSHDELVAALEAMRSAIFPEEKQAAKQMADAALAKAREGQ